ncbi:DNRLRE domain-containing protein [Streptomyces sp. NPDC004726]
MAAALLDGASAAAAKAADVAPPQKRAATVESAADVASARVAARLSGKRVEAVSERTETSTTWANKDGSLTTELVAGPVRFADKGSGDWREVDLDLVKAAGGAVAPRAHPRGLRLAGKAGTPARSMAAAAAAKATDLVTLGEGDQRITLQWKGGLPAPKLSGTRAEYANAVPGADVVVEATRTGFEQFVEIRQRPATAGYTYTLPLRAEGLRVRQLPDGSVRFTDKENKTRAVMPAPVMWDSTVDPVSGEHTRRVPVAMKAVERPGGVDLVVTPDAKFLADPKTKYPVTVDPSTSALGNVFDTYVQQGETVDWSADTELDLGNPGTTNPNGTPRTARSFISWNTEPIQNALITEAKLSLWNFHSGNTACTAQPWEVWSAGAASTASRWTAQPAWTAEKATSTETRGNAACTSAPDGWINADVSTLVQEWSSSNVTRGHMGLRATSETVTAQWKRVNSANAASNPPKLVVTYNYRPRTGTKQEAGPPYFSSGGAYTVNTLQPVLRDTFVDANGDKVNGTFQIFDSVTNTQVGSVLVSPFVPSGKTASVTVPAGVLTNGKTYKFRTSPYDGAHYNTGWSAWKTFTVDTTRPAVPAGITSTDYPTGQWVKGAGQAGVFTVTPPAADHNWLEWSLDGVTWTKATTGGAPGAKNISVTPETDGTQSLEVRTVDKADNKSEPIEYTFHAGPGGFLQPLENERTARRLPLVAEADASKYDSASFSWRRSEADPWTVIPPAQVTASGTPLSAWPVALTGGRNAPLVWDAATSVGADGAVEIKADFTGTGGVSGSTEPLSVIVNRNADGAATAPVGPGALNLLTGDYTLAQTDVSSYGMSVTRTASSRNPQAGADDNQAPIFGPQWHSGVTAETTDSDYSHIRRTSDTAVAVVETDGSETYFTANAAQNRWIPEPGAEVLTLTGTPTTSFTLTSVDGAVVHFTKPDANAVTWQVSATLFEGLDNSTTTVVSETVTVGGDRLARPQRIIAPTSAATATQCATAPSTKGCRALQFVYATTTTATSGTNGDYAGRVKEIRLWSTEPGATAATSRSVQMYQYDSDGRLTRTWHPQITPSVVTRYVYDAAGRVTEITPPGELPWTFTYGNAGTGGIAADGMLLNASRPALATGTSGTLDGEAVTSVVYGVPLSGTSAPYGLGASDVRTWGQTGLPTDATAVFPPDSVPSGHNGGSLAVGAYGRATVHYLDASARRVNMAEPGGHISSVEYDRHGNTVRQLSAANRAIALNISADAQSTQAELGIGQLTGAERAELLSTRTVYDTTGTRELEGFGPLRRITLTKNLQSGSTVLVAEGTSVTARAWTKAEYDTGRPTDGSASVSDQVTKTTSGAQVREHPDVFAETRVSETQYDWGKGLPVKEIRDPGGLAVTTETQYDAEGREIKNILPGGTGTDAATTVTTYWSATGTGTCQGRPEWTGLVCSTGPGGAITGGGANPSERVTRSVTYDWWGNEAAVTETANGSTRTLTTTRDQAGRPTTATVSGPGQAVPESTTEYDAATGRPSRSVSPTGGTITKTYDELGRQTEYTDADGGVTSVTYDRLNRPVQVSDNVPSTQMYTYDHTLEPRGLATKVVDSVAGTFSTAYTPDGSVRSEQLPGGYSLEVTEDASGAQTGRTYTRDSDGTVLYSDSVTMTSHGQAASHTGWSEQAYTYDALGRMAIVEDTADTVCTRRSYTFSPRANRTALTTASAEAGIDCPTTGGTTQSSSYDSADRIVSTGYAYDALGRTTTLPGGTTLGYYANDRVHQETKGSERQTWKLDAAHRFRSWTRETGGGSTWSQTAARVNHYSGDSDSPRWITENAAGAVTRYVDSPTGALAASTGRTGDVVLHLTTIHGDIALNLPLTAGRAPEALDTDEYGNPRAGGSPARYGWLGKEQRSAETVSGLTLMGARLYNPATGRFASVDPVDGGNSNAYDYCSGDPVGCSDTTGQFSINDIWHEGEACVKYWWLCGSVAQHSAWVAWTAKRTYKNSNKQNAYRHCLWQAILTWDLGDWVAKAFGDAHEKKHKNSKDKKKKEDSRVDDLNNEVGRKIGAQITAWTLWGAGDAACARCKKALRNGKLHMRRNV